MEKLWTTTEVAGCLGLDEAEVEVLVRDGRLTGYQLGGQYLRFRPDQVRALKGTVRVKAQHPASADRPSEGWPQKLREMVYFYDFYIVSAVLLISLVVYLIAEG